MSPVADPAGALHGVRKLLAYGDLSFRDFMEVALYHPEFGYYSRVASPIGKDGDYVTSPLLSPVFSFALSRLATEFVRRAGDEVSTVVDIGCGDGLLINTICSQWSPAGPAAPRFFGVDRAPDRALPGCATVVRTLHEVPFGRSNLLISNELFDAFPFARLVQRGEDLHELWVTDEGEALGWKERETTAEYQDYFAARGITLEEGQFADISLEWEAFYRDLCERSGSGMIVTFDYGYPEDRLFRFRRFGTAAAYGSHRVTRDLLANPGQQDLTAHINFTDLIRAGERAGFKTLFFDRQAKFLLALGATEHPLLQPPAEVSSLDEAVELVQQRQDAKRLILPDDIGNDIRVLVQVKDVAVDGWSFQRALF